MKKFLSWAVLSLFLLSPYGAFAQSIPGPSLSGGTTATILPPLPLPTGAATEVTLNFVLDTTIDVLDSVAEHEMNFQAVFGISDTLSRRNDSPSGATDAGIPALAVLKSDFSVSLNLSEGDYSNNVIDSFGAHYASLTDSSDGLLPRFEDAVSAGGDPGIVSLVKRDDVLTAGAGVNLDLDYSVQRVDNFGSTWSALSADDGARLPASSTDGLLVNLGSNNDVTIPVSGAAFFTITDTMIAAVSQNFAFGFTSEKVLISTPASNSDDVCIDHAGATAVCPAVDTAGDDRLTPGTSIVLDAHAVTSVSAISASGTNTITVRAFN